MQVDLLVRGGIVVDGTGADPYQADVAILGDRLEAVGTLPDDVGAREVLDASGRAVTPGFVDVHLHTDTAPLSGDPDTQGGLPSLRQGVTTEVGGNCGFSPFPVGGEVAESVGGLLETALGDGARFFADYESYRRTLEDRPLGPNYAPLVGHGALRMEAVGFDDRRATEDEVRSMCRALDRALAEGCFGMSTGLIYPPSMFAPTEEIVELARVVARHERLYTTHIRNEGNLVREAIAEAVAIGRESGAAVQISHHKVAGRPNWGRSAQTLQQVDMARAAGEDVALDVYPYTASSTGMLALLPRWLLDGGVTTLDRLRDQETRDAIQEEARAAEPGVGTALVTAPETVVVSSANHHSEIEGKQLNEIAADAGKDPFDAACDLLVEDLSVHVIVHQMAEEDVARILTHPLAVIGSDGGLATGKPHPRRAGTFARVLGRYVRERELLDLAAAVHKMTGQPAERFGLVDRGELAPGRHADVVVLDPGHVLDGATYEDPLAPPTGVDHVIVNGTVAVRDGVDTGRRAGRVLEPS